MKVKYLLPTFLLLAVVSAGYVYAMPLKIVSTPTTSNNSTNVASSNTRTNPPSPLNATGKSNAGSNAKNQGIVGLQKACIKHENNIKNRSERLYNLSNTIINNFSTILSRVQNYYNNTLLPKGIVVSNYAALSAAVLSSQDTAEGQLNQFNLDFQNFSCSSTNPHTQIVKFNTDMRTEITDLNLYKKAVINLLDVVRSRLQFVS